MKIYTLWGPSVEDDDIPWLVDSVDEYSIESIGGFPESYKKHVEEGKGQYRELIIEVPDKAVISIFAIPTLVAKLP